MKKQTQLVRNQVQPASERSHSVPLYLTSSFTFESAEEMRDTFNGEIDKNIYSRYSNPNLQEFIEKVCLLENKPAGFATASGMSAVYLSLASFLKAGDHVLASCALFGSSHQILNNILSKFGVTTTYVDPENTSTWEDSVQENTKLFLIETPSNPGLKIIDLEFCGQFCEQHGLIYVVDNCFATPILQKPADYGAHIIVHSATKYMDGQGRVLGGVLVGDSELMEEVIFFARHTGPIMSPFNAWLLSKSLETLSLRIKAHSSNALEVAQFLTQRDEVTVVHYPFLPSFPQHELAKKQMTMGGGIVTFELKGDIEKVFSFINHLNMISKTSNLGDTRTIVTHPSTTTHSKLSEEERQLAGISNQLIRISVGLEDVEDIIDDLRQSLDLL
ncbi:trans-sulfuration enzyme family protein [Membranihabitans marinus]|uniref:trans-sulfuration enzyme family protein n=1 Tax=Membranihabitans marinus TaxID=1227546 RepID=UPI001F01B7BB|nr:aminotransferase class I/II-fold pyridoxal phosphate-dependent enzyme [Membranihabitans marinus]